jgi:hypothetical protein
MKQLMVDNNTAASHSFLLDDDSSIPFSLDDIAALMEDKVLHCPALYNMTSSCCLRQWGPVLRGPKHSLLVTQGPH